MNRVTFCAVAGLLAALALSGRAAVPEAYRQAWEAARPQMDASIERYRKADATLVVTGADGRPLVDAAVELQQTSHEFLFGCNLFALGQLAKSELNRKYEEQFAKLFNFATIPFYWRELEPEPGKPRFDEKSKPIWRRPPPDIQCSRSLS